MEAIFFLTSNATHLRYCGFSQDVDPSYRSISSRDMAAAPSFNPLRPDDAPRQRYRVYSDGSRLFHVDLHCGRGLVWKGVIVVANGFKIRPRR